MITNFSHKIYPGLIKKYSKCFYQYNSNLILNFRFRKLFGKVEMANGIILYDVKRIYLYHIKDYIVLWVSRGGWRWYQVHVVANEL